MTNPNNPNNWYAELNADYDWYHNNGDKCRHNCAMVWYWLCDNLQKYGGGKPSIEACAGLLGNMYIESTVNPNLWEWYFNQTEHIPWVNGYGLVQWTPMALDYISYQIGIEGTWDNYDQIVAYAQAHPNEWQANGPQQMRQLLYEATHNLQWAGNANATQSGLPTNPAFTMLEFFSDTRFDAWYYGEAWLYYYERPANPTVGQRGTFARDVVLPYLQSLPPWHRGMPVYMMMNYRR